MTSLSDHAATATPGSAAAAVAWSHRGELRVTVVAKATFAFALDADMPRVAPRAIVRADVHHQNNPAKSVHFASDLAPVLGLVDVVLTGHAAPPAPGAPGAEAVRLTVVDGGQTVLDKQILVRDAPGAGRTPLVYENAYGGVGVVENPLGTATPSLVDPRDPRRPACFAPLGRSWPSRRHLLGKTQRKVLDAAVAAIPDDFAWAYYQAAPEDQRIARLGGGAWIMLGGLIAGQPLARMRLPDVTGVAYVYGLAADPVELALALDTVHVDGDEERCHVVLRGNVPVPSEAALGALRVVAGVASAGAPLVWPTAVDEPAAPAESSPGPTGTVALTGAEEPGRTLPFVPAGSPAGTISLTPDDQRDAAARPAVPFAEPPATEPPPPQQHAVASAETPSIEPEPDEAQPPAAPARDPIEVPSLDTAPAPAQEPRPAPPAPQPPDASPALKHGLYGRYGKG